VSLRRVVARGLEQGTYRSIGARLVARIWEKSANPIRRVRLPIRPIVIGVGGPTLGGSYKTPLVLSLSRALTLSGARVAIVGHGYGAHVRGVTRVRPDDDVGDVGDDALWLARSEPGVAVFVGSNRESTLARAAAGADVVIVDGLLQTRPRRLSLSILVVDAARPWGSGACPPRGDLRAAEERLVAAADCVISVRDAAAKATLGAVLGAKSILHGARTPNAFVPIADLPGYRVGLALAIGHPERVLNGLLSRGVTPVTTCFFADHERLLDHPDRSSGFFPEVDAWLTTPKCRTKMQGVFRGAPVWTLEHEVVPPDALIERISCILRPPEVSWQTTHIAERASVER